MDVLSRAWVHMDAKPRVARLIARCVDVWRVLNVCPARGEAIRPDGPAKCRCSVIYAQNATVTRTMLGRVRARRDREAAGMIVGTARGPAG
jgi:hypothetical protein